MFEFHVLSLEAQFVFGTNCKAVGLICKYSIHRGSDGLVLYSTDHYCIGNAKEFENQPLDKVQSERCKLP